MPKFYTRLKKCESSEEFYIESGVKFKALSYDRQSTYTSDESGVVFFHKDRNECLLGAANGMIREAERLIKMVK